MLKLLFMCMLLSVSPVFAEDNISPKWVSDLNAARDAEQLVIVSGTHGSNARFSFHEKDNDGVWHEIISAPAFSIPRRSSIGFTPAAISLLASFKIL